MHLSIRPDNYKRKVKKNKKIIDNILRLEYTNAVQMKKEIIMNMC